MNPDIMQRLRDANPLPDEEVSEFAPNRMGTTPFVSKADAAAPGGEQIPRRRRATSIVGVAVALTLGAGAMGAAAASTETGHKFLSVFTGTTAPLPDSRELPQPEPELNMASPEFRALVDDWTRNPNLDNVSLPPLPRGSTSIAVPPGMTHEQVFGELYERLFDGDATQSTITTVSLSAAIDYQIVQAWYRYWLRSGPTQREEAQGILDTFQDWPDLWRSNPSHYDMPGSGEMIAIARIAEAARHNDGAPMRAWLDEKNPIPEPDDPYLDVHSPDWTAFIAADVASIPLPPGSSRRTVFDVIYDELPMPTGATADHWRGVVGDRFRGSGLTWEQDSETGEVLGVKRSTMRGQADELAVHTWYRYWLNANLQQRRAAQPVLDAMGSWPGLTQALSRSSGNRIGKVRAIARAASKNDPKPMRQWLTQARQSANG